MNYTIHKVASLLGISVYNAKRIVFIKGIKPIIINYQLYYYAAEIDELKQHRIYPIVAKPKKPYFEFAYVTIKSKNICGDI